MVVYNFAFNQLHLAYYLAYYLTIYFIRIQLKNPTDARYNPNKCTSGSIILCCFLLFLSSHKEERTHACKGNRHDYKYRNYRNWRDTCANKLQPLI